VLRYACISQLVIIFDVGLLYSPLAYVNQPKALVTSDGYHMLTPTCVLIELLNNWRHRPTGKHVGEGSITVRGSWMVGIVCQWTQYSKSHLNHFYCIKFKDKRFHLSLKRIVLFRCSGYLENPFFFFFNLHIGWWNQGPLATAAT
jgi:hypothetical protein